MIVRPGRHSGRLPLPLVAAALAVAWGAGCADEKVIELEPVFPNDEPNLLELADVEELVVTAEPLDEGTEEAPRTVELARGEGLRMSLPEGTWRIDVTGTSSSVEVVHGTTAPFAVERGRGQKVRFFLGRSMSFNEVRVEPVDLANALGDLVGASAVAYTDSSGHPWVLVTGGTDGEGGPPVSDAYLVDPTDFSIEKLASMSCTRAGHQAFTLEGDSVGLVVLSGGESGGCLGDLEIFDTEARTFARIDACGLGSTRGAVPRLSDSGGAKPAQDGWVIIPGNPRCKVNPFTGETVTGLVWEDPAPGAPLQAAINPSGRMLIATQHSLFVDTSGEEDSGGHDQCVIDDAWLPEAVWFGVEGRADAVMHALEDERFIYLGGLLPGGEDPDPRYGWSVVTAGECKLSTVVDGELAADQPRTGFSLLELGPHDGDDIGLLIAGGRVGATGAALDKVFMFSQVQGASAPTVHDLSVQSRSFTVEMKRPRAGHAAARMENGDYWIFGGGASVPEVFVRGSTDIRTFHEVLKKRSPTLASVSVLDTLPVPLLGEEVSPVSQLFSDKYVDLLYSQWTEFRNMLFFVVSADLGIQDGLLDVPPAGSAGCEEEKPLNIQGTASGDVSNIDFPDVETFPIDDPSAFNVEAVKSWVRDAIGTIDQGADDCGWRQLLRAGLAGMDRSVEVGELNLDDPTLGVNILFFVTTQDDCSQGIYDGFDLEPADPPSPAVLAAEYCSSDSYDDYFGLPPGYGETAAAFEELVGDLSWDPEDLLVVLFGNGGESPTCTAGDLGSLDRPARLLETMELMDDLRVETLVIDLCEHNTVEDLADPMKDLLERIGARNPHQACLPQGVLDADPQFDADRGQYVPVEPDKAVAQDVADVCHLVYVEEEPLLVGETNYRIALTVDRDLATDPEVAWVGTDSDGRAQCPSNKTSWLMRVDKDRLEEKTGASTNVQVLDLICLP